MEEGQAKNEFKPPVVEETVVESETVVSKESAASGAPVFKDERKKMSGGVIVCIVILAVLAIGGIGFGVWAMLSQNDKIASLETDLANCAASNNSSTENVEVTCPDGTSTEIVKNVITNVTIIKIKYLSFENKLGVMKFNMQAIPNNNSINKHFFTIFFIFTFLSYSYSCT